MMDGMHGPASVGSGSAGSSSATSQATEIKHLADRLNAAQVKVKRLARLEAAIVDFFMEIMERTASLPTTSRHRGDGCDESEGSTSEFARAKRKEEFVRKAEGDPMALLNALRTHLRVQFSALETQHHEMGSAIDKLTTRGARHALDADEELRKWESACDLSKQQMRALAQQLTTTQNDHDRVTRQSMRALEQLNRELQTLRATNETQREQLSKRQADIDELKRANDALARDRKRFASSTEDAGRGNNGGGNGSPNGHAMTTATSTKSLLGNTPAEQQNLKRVLQDYECKLSKMASTNDELRDELRRQQQSWASLKSSTQAQHCAKLEKDVKKYREVKEETSKRLADQEAELLRTRGTLKERDVRIQSMKDEYNKLFTALQKIKQTPSTQSQSQSQARLLLRSASTANVGLSKASTTRNLLSSASRRAGGGGEGGGGGATDGERGAGGATISSAELLRHEANENPYLLDHYKGKIEQQEKEMLRMQTQIRKMIASEYRHKQKNKLFHSERGQLKDTCDTLRSELERAVKTSAKAMAQQQPLRGLLLDDTDADASGGGHTSNGGGRPRTKPQREPQHGDGDASSVNEDDGEGDDDDDDNGGCGENAVASNQFCCSISDVLRLRQRNQFLEERFRQGMDTEVTKTPVAIEAGGRGGGRDVRPPRASSSGPRGPLQRSSSSTSMAEIPTTGTSGTPHKSIDSQTMQALQQVKYTARTRPQSAGAGARATLPSKPSVAIKSLL